MYNHLKKDSSLELKKLDKYIIEDIEGDEHPSDFIKRDGFNVLILRLPEVDLEVTIKSYAYIIEGDRVSIYNREKKSLEDFGSLDDLLDALNSKIEKLISDVKRYHILIDNLEESIYADNLSNTFMQEWLSYKKDVSLINRLMFHASVTVEQLVLSLKKESSVNIHALEDIKEETKRVYDLSKSALEKLDNLYSFYSAKVDEKMNKNVYYLTLLSGIFLPLTLLTGFFGMNTGGLPLANDPMGTWKVVAISLVLEVIFFLPFILQNFKKIEKFKR